MSGFPERAEGWCARYPWPCGFNYVPSSAVNTTAMWRDGSFDAKTIGRELGWAEALGFNSCRVFLPYLVWETEGARFLDRFEQLLDLAAASGLTVMPVLFDDCAFSGKQPYPGAQDAPVPGIHNSGWTPSPGHALVADASAWPGLEGYVRSLMRRFGRDKRVYMWDLYNEPGNSDMGNRSLPLLRAVFAWARDAAPAQPLTAGVWNADLADLNEASVEMSDVVSFHSYLDLNGLRREVDRLHARAGPRKLICTEWMARSFNSCFATHLPYFRQQGIGCYSWGLVKGKTQTHFPWGSTEGAPEPDPWFHDLLHPDGTPYAEADVAALEACRYADGTPPGESR